MGYSRAAAAALLAAIAAQCAAQDEVEQRVNRLFDRLKQRITCELAQSLKDKYCYGRKNSQRFRTCKGNRDQRKNCDSLRRKASKNIQCAAMRKLVERACGTNYKDAIEKEMTLAADCLAAYYACVQRRIEDEQRDNFLPGRR